MVPPGLRCRGTHGWRAGWGTSSNIIDPDVIVLGGDLSGLSHLYERLPRLMGPYIFADRGSVVIKAPKWGEAGRARGAAQLWDLSLS
jgi:predicted NBD/HSP70 family sugar kinase